MKNFDKLPISIQKSINENANNSNKNLLLLEILYDAIWTKSNETSLFLVDALFEVFNTNCYYNYAEFLQFFEYEPKVVFDFEKTILLKLHFTSKISKSIFIEKLTELRAKL
jgi:hypothetical protein